MYTKIRKMPFIFSEEVDFVMNHIVCIWRNTALEWLQNAPVESNSPSNTEAPFLLSASTNWIDHAKRLRRESFLIEWVVVALQTEVRRRKWTLESEWKSGVRASQIPTCRCKLPSVRIAGTIEELPSAPEEACPIDRPVEMFVNWQ